MLVVRRGAEALALLRSERFQAKWRALYERCPWAWAELPELLVPWYEVYDEYEPIVVTEEDAERLQGLLLLCEDPHEARLLQGGHWDAEYISWLCEPDLTDRFMSDALDAVRSEIGPVRVELEWMLPETPLGWLEQSAGARCQVLTDVCHYVPLEDSADFQDYVQSKKRLRTKMNKLRRQGDLKYREYTTSAELEHLFKYFFPLFHSRRNALHGEAVPPIEEQRRKQQLLKRFASTPGLFHAVALELDGVPIAMHMAPGTRGIISIGGLAHSPEWEKLSPGMLLLVEQMKSLHDQGFVLFDMSPGEEGHKGRLGSHKRIASRVIVHPSRAACAASKTKKKLRSLAKQVLTKAKAGSAR